MFEPHGVWFDLNSYTRMLSTFLWNWPGYYWRKRRDTPPGSLLARILSKFWGPNVKIFSTAFFVLSAQEHSYRLWIAWMHRGSATFNFQSSSGFNGCTLITWWFAFYSLWCVNQKENRIVYIYLFCITNFGAKSVTGQGYCSYEKSQISFKISDKGSLFDSLE